MPTPKIDPKIIFASDAPAQDKPAVFNNYTKGMDETRKNDGRPTIKQANALQQTTDQKILWIHENGAALPYDETIDYMDGSIVLKDGELQEKSGAEWIPLMSNTLKGYTSLAGANADIANMKVGQVVTISSNEDGGLYYKATEGATSLTKSPYDPLTLAKADATTKANAAETNAKNHTDTSIEELGVENSSKQTNTLFAVVDFSGRKTAIEIGMDGKLTEYSANSIADSVGIKQAGSNSLLWALTDADGRRTWLGVGADGKPDPYTVQCMREALDVEEKTDVLKFCFDGDSMTAGAGSNGNPVTKWFNELLVADGITNAQITNFGVGGETSVTICARQGGNPFIVTVDDGVIPATAEPVRVTLQPINGQPVRPMLQGASSWAGELNGLKGTLRIVKPNGGSTWDEANYYTFTRSTAGSQITANRPMEFHLDIARQNADAIHVIWIGQNGPSIDRAISDAKAMIERIESPNKKFIVISKPTSTDADDARYFEHFGNRFIAARKYLVQYGLEDAGITPTAQDLEDISNGIVPTSLRSDTVHWLASGYQILAKLLFNRMKNLGWI